MNLLGIASLVLTYSAGLVWPTIEKGNSAREVTSAFQLVANALFNPPSTAPRHHVVFHTLRHTFASRLIGAGVELTTAKEIMGHSATKMLERYAHLIPGAQEAALAVLE